MKTRLFSFVLIIVCFYSSAQQSDSSKVEEIEVLNADNLLFDEQSGIRAMRLVGNVSMKQGETLLFCDSAYFFSTENKMKAFGNVKIQDPDSLLIYADFADYDGDAKFAKLRNNVKLIQGNSTLKTDYLDYDRYSNYAYFQNGGRVENKTDNSTLFSKRGRFNPSLNLFYFRDSVRFKNTEYGLYADSLNYNQILDITYFLGPTNIVKDSTHIYCESGYLDSPNDISVFVKNASILDANQQIYGDSIHLNQKMSIGQVFGNVSLIDTSEKFIITGDYAKNNQIDSTTLVFGDPELIQYYDEGDSLFIHGDTIQSYFDSSRTKRIVSVHYKVKFFKSDLQGKCDSLVYAEQDSMIKLFGDPIVWAEENQITASYIQLKTFDGKMQFMDIEENAFIGSFVDSLHFNQISGDTMKGYFNNNELYLVNVFGNGKTLYFLEDEEDSSITAVNLANSRLLDIYIDSSAVKRILFFDTPTAKLIPIEDASITEKQLTGFNWRQTDRPLKRADIFIWPEAKAIEKNNKLMNEEKDVELQGGGRSRQRKKTTE